MRSSLAAFGLTCQLAASVASAQEGPRSGFLPSRLFGRGQTAPKVDPAVQPAGAGAPSSAKADPKVFPASSSLPTPIPPDQIKPATIALPNDPVDPFLLTKDNGPFMVTARTFRGPQAERFALALVKELRQEYGLPAYILRTKDFPNHSVMRNVPPLAPSYVKRPELGQPEKTRSYDEAAVLVGDCKTLDESEALWHRVKKIKPKCLDEIPTIFGWRHGLSTATRTTNPFVPTQNIFPGRGPRDRLVHTMNGGPRSIYNCPGRYTIQVAEFGGRASFNPDQKTLGMFTNDWLRKSPLVTAADDAERLAERIAKDPELQKTGFQPYVYHDRTSSKVMMGSFNQPNDPAAVKLREILLKRTGELAFNQRGIVAPAAQLTDLEDPNRPIKLAQAP